MSTSGQDHCSSDLYENTYICVLNLWGMSWLWWVCRGQVSATAPPAPSAGTPGLSLPTGAGAGLCPSRGKEILEWSVLLHCWRLAFQNASGYFSNIHIWTSRGYSKLFLTSRHTERCSCLAVAFWMRRKLWANAISKVLGIHTFKGTKGIFL